MSWVVPGANPSSAIIVSDRVSTNTPLTVTAITQATAQTILSLTLSLDTVSNISIFGNFTATVNTGTERTISYFIETFVNGTTSVAGYINQNTVQGNGHHMICPILVGTFKTPVSNVIIRLKVFASAASSFSVAPAQLLAIGNISQD